MFPFFCLMDKGGYFRPCALKFALGSYGGNLALF